MPIKKKKKLLFVFGTRPEALKLAPLILAAQQDKQFSVQVCLTAQHRKMVDDVLSLFKIKANFDLNIMKPNQTLASLSQRLLSKLPAVTEKAKPDYLIVQGDTSSAFITGLHGFYAKIPIVHIEAGLRSYQKYSPFPEEMNRLMLSHLADLHFAPTSEAKDNLLREGIAGKKIWVTGNTIVDALQTIRPRIQKFLKTTLPEIEVGKRIILVTAHRRESFGAEMKDMFLGFRKIAKEYPDVEIVYPVHLNPNVKVPAEKLLAGVKNIHLIPPVDYVQFLCLMELSFLVLTDSGGVQEEAPSFNKPVLVMRKVTERMEGVRAGVARLIGTDAKSIVKHTRELLKNKKSYAAMIGRKNPYGDGKSCQKILKVLSNQDLFAR